MARAAAARYRAAAERAAEVILGGLLGADGRLGRSWKDGRATGQGVLEDYANLAEGLLALYEATFDERWFTTARALADAILERFTDPDGGFFDTATDHERLVTRPKDIQDNATPSGGSVRDARPPAPRRVHRRSLATATAAERALSTVTAYATRYPTAFAMWLQAIDLALAPVAEIAIVGDPSDDATRALLAVASGGYEPNRVVAVLADGGARRRSRCSRPGSQINGRPTAYVCRDFACRLPVTDPDALRDQLAEVAGAV